MKEKFSKYWIKFSNNSHFSSQSLRYSRIADYFLVFSCVYVIALQVRGSLLKLTEVRSLSSCRNGKGVSNGEGRVWSGKWLRMKRSSCEFDANRTSGICSVWSLNDLRKIRISSRKSFQNCLYLFQIYFSSEDRFPERFLNLMIQQMALQENFTIFSK